jgi:hypothetical protein
MAVNESSCLRQPSKGDGAEMQKSRLMGDVRRSLGPCLNVNGGVANPGTPVIAYHCIPDVADEQWDSVS